MVEIWLAGLLLPLSYLLGTVPSGVIAGRLTGNVDPREYGSGRTGAANIFRTLGWMASLAVFGADFAKGAIPVVAARFLGGPLWLEAAVALAAVAGHDWPIYLGFRGGRGVSTSVGAMTAMSPGVGMASLATFAVIVLITRYASLGSLLGSALSLVAMLARAWTGQEPVEYAVFCVLAVGLIFVQHRDNMIRLARGTERRLDVPGRAKSSRDDRG